MYWGMKLHNMMRLRSYEECERYFEETRPQVINRPTWKDTPAVPLDGPRKRHVRMTKNENSFTLKLYDTDLVTYNYDGSVLVNTYPSDATMDFLSNVVPPGITALYSRTMAVMYLRVKTPNGARYVLPRHTRGIYFCPLGEGSWTWHESEIRRRVGLLVNARRIAPMFKRVQPIVDWRKITMRLGVEVDPSQLIFMRRKATENSEAILRAVKDRALWGQTFNDCAPDEIPFLVALAEGIVRILGNENICTLPPRKSTLYEQKWIPIVAEVHKT